MTITETTRSLVNERLKQAREEQAVLDAHRAQLEQQLDDVMMRLNTVTHTVTDLETDLGLQLGDPVDEDDEPIADPWAEPIPYVPTSEDDDLELRAMAPDDEAEGAA